MPRIRSGEIISVALMRVLQDDLGYIGRGRSLEGIQEIVFLPPLDGIGHKLHIVTFFSVLRTHYDGGI